LKPLCYSPWTNLDIAPRGRILPCCKFNAESYHNTHNIVDSTIEEYQSSDFLNTIKDQMLEHKWPKGCERCKIEEQNNILSKRQLDNQRWKEQYKSYTSDDGFITASIAFGNTCNLKCIMCSPYSSSRWRKEYLDLFGEDIKPLETVTNLADVYFPNLIHIDIPGGEPFLSEVEKQKDMLQKYVNSGQSKSITLHYTTNAQVFPDNSWWELWKNFKDVEIQLSIDGIDTAYEYIRYPAVWNTLLKNIDQYQSTRLVRLSVSHTVSAYNIYYLHEFFDWCYVMDLPTPWCGRADRPKHMRPTVWPKSIQQHISKKLKSSHFPDVKNWGNMLENNNDSDQYNTFISETARHDEYRSTSFAKTFPQMEELINGIQ
jgi:radical SAM protein with 4Fe4S-binding SPASM domain